jgi:hypothetical protein
MFESSEEAFQEARRAWREALRDHVLAPPDAGFSKRIAALASAAATRAQACEAAAADGRTSSGRASTKPSPNSTA